MSADDSIFGIGEELFLKVNIFLLSGDQLEIAPMLPIEWNFLLQILEQAMPGITKKRFDVLEGTTFESIETDRQEFFTSMIAAFPTLREVEAPTLAPLVEAVPLLFQLQEQQVKIDQIPLGAGANGVVFSAKLTGAPVAAKTLHMLRDPQLYRLTDDTREIIVAEIRNEATMLQQLRHPNILMFFGVLEITAAPWVYLISERAAISLEERLALPFSEFSFDSRVKACHEAICGVAYLHQSKLIHRDLKPSNILFANGLVKIADVGEAVRNNRARISKRGAPLYQAIDETATPSSDIFSLGLVIGETLTGNPLTKTLTLPVHYRTFNERASWQEETLRLEPLYSHISLKNLQQKSWATQLKNRYQDGYELLSAWETIFVPPDC